MPLQPPARSPARRSRLRAVASHTFLLSPLWPIGRGRPRARFTRLLSIRIRESWRISFHGIDSLVLREFAQRPLSSADDKLGLSIARLIETNESKAKRRTNLTLRWLNTLCIARTEPHIWFLRQEGDEISAPVVRSSAVTGDGGGGGGDGGFAPSQYVASAIRKERERGRERWREERWPPRLNFCVRSKKCRRPRLPIAAHWLRSTKDGATGLVQ